MTKQAQALAAYQAQHILIDAMLDAGDPIATILREERKLTALRQAYQATLGA